MKMIGRFTKLVIAMIMVALPLLPNTAAFVESNNFNDPNMQIVWERTDKPVELFVTQRSYMWGPNTLPGSPSTEPYANSPGGNRTVQYFDKSRMEVNNPNGDRSDLFFITDGLLVREMVSGQLQLGDTLLESRAPSFEAVAGDPAPVNPDSPTYTTFHSIASTSNNNPSPDRTGQPVVEAISKVAVTSTVASPDPSVTYVSFEPTLKHNMPNKFVDFLNQTGPVFVNGTIQQNQLVINGVFLAGLPITEAFWVKAKVAGVEKDVLVQLFERRVLTYTPSNPAGFQVEMGNVGQHYFRWRYATTPTPPPTEERIVFHSDRSGSLQIYTMKTDGSDVKQLTTAGANFQARWSPDNHFIAFTSTRDGNEEIYVMNADGSNQRRVTVTPAANEEIPNWSPDGTRLYFVRITANGFKIWSMTSEGGDQKQLTNTPGFIDFAPVPSPDGKKVSFETDRDGDPEVYVMNVDGGNQTRLTVRTGTRNEPTDWKGNNILFDSFTSMTTQIWTMNSDGGAQTKVSGDLDRTGSFSPDMQRIVFTRLGEVSSNRNANIWVMDANGTNPQNLTNNTGVVNADADWSN